MNKIEELELKHLAPYLPYGLKFIDNGKVSNVVYMSSKRLALVNVRGYGEVWKCNFENLPKNTKPILHPLSDLHKEIVVNGAKYIPMQHLERLNQNDPIDITQFGLSIDNGFAAAYNLLHAYEFLTTLFEWKFDVFGLIPDRLAIDVNTLETNPYS